MKVCGSVGAMAALLAFAVASSALQISTEGHAAKNSDSYLRAGFIEIPQAVSADLVQPFPQGSRLIHITTEEPPRIPSNMTQQFFAVAYPQISFDGVSMLFSGQKEKGSSWQIWEMAADGSNLRQITHCSGDCLQGAYLPLNQIVYMVIRGTGSQGESTLYVSQRDGENAHAITFGPGNFQVERVLHSGRILISAELPLRVDANGTSHRALYVMRPDGTGLHLLPPGSAVASETFSGANGSRASLAPHTAPLSFPSILHLELQTGRVLCLNSYASSDAIQGRITRSITQVRVFALGPDNQEHILGNAPVEKDGSFYVTVPADTPIRFALLDAHGAVIREQKSWIWARPGEDRGCLGCHENPALAPENHWPLTLQRFDTPTPVGITAHPNTAKKDH